MISQQQKEKLLNQRGKVIWFTGLSGAGKSTIAESLEELLHFQSFKTQLLDADTVREGINKNLRFTMEDRYENIRRIAEISKLLCQGGIICLNAFISPTREIRELAKGIIGKENYLEIYVNTSIEVCEKRDSKGLYKAARAGLIPHFTGISSPYEKPEKPDFKVNNSDRPVEEAVNEVYRFILPHIIYTTG